MNVSAVIPVFNSESTLDRLTEELSGVLKQHADEFEIILVDDGSRDGSWLKIRELCKRYSDIRAFRLGKNFGQHNALLAGIRAAKHEIIVTLDDDLQNPPSEIPKLFDMLVRGYDVVYGKPAKAGHSVFRNLSSSLTKLVLQTAMGAENASSISAFRAFRTKLRDAFALYDNPLVSIDILLTWGTNKFSAVDVNHNPREVGKSNYNFFKLVTHAMNMITGFSTFPLRVASSVGLASTVLGLCLLTFVLLRYFIQGCPVPGFAFLASTIVAFGGVQLFSLGVMGEYISRMYEKSSTKPPYVIEAESGAGVTELERACAGSK